jgi:hypothetical protein
MHEKGSENGRYLGIIRKLARHVLALLAGFKSCHLI